MRIILLDVEDLEMEDAKAMIRTGFMPEYHVVISVVKADINEVALEGADVADIVVEFIDLRSSTPLH